jgi:hypothetical protein
MSSFKHINKVRIYQDRLKNAEKKEIKYITCGVCQCEVINKYIITHEKSYKHKNNLSKLESQIP